MLEMSRQLRISTVDLGQPDEGYMLSPGQTEVTRRRIIRTQMLPAMMAVFAKYPALQSAMLILAQYWCDEADDAVHAMFSKRANILYGRYQQEEFSQTVHVGERRKIFDWRDDNVERL